MSYLKDTQREGPWKHRECLSQGQLRESYQGLTFTHDSAAVIWGICSRERLESGQGDCKPCRHTKWMLRQQYYGVVYLNSQYYVYIYVYI